MDVVSAALTVCSLCNRIIDWIKKLSEKEFLLKDVSFTVLQVHDLLHPFTSSTFNREGMGEYQLSQSIRSVGAVLRRIDEHIQVYKLKKTQKILAFLSPGAVIQKLKDDQQQLNHQLIILLASITTVGYLRDHARDQESDKALVALTKKFETTSNDDQDTLVSTNSTALDELQYLEDALEFWRDYIGAKASTGHVEFAANDLFSARLISWSNGDLTAKTCDLILMRLDEFNSGVITPQSLVRVLGKQSLKIFVQSYTKRGESYVGSPWDSDPASIPKFNSGSDYSYQLQVRLPLLVWIDDCPENIASEIQFARRHGVQVIQLLSTAEAKMWVDENFAFLRKYGDPSRIRFISDNVRLEAVPSADPNAPAFLNASAGQNLLHYLRGRLINAPVLIYTGMSVDLTGFVRNYAEAGSTTDPTICLRYISNLAGGVGSDCEWKGFKVQIVSTL